MILIHSGNLEEILAQLKARQEEINAQRARMRQYIAQKVPEDKVDEVYKEITEINNEEAYREAETRLFALYGIVFDSMARMMYGSPLN